MQGQHVSLGNRNYKATCTQTVTVLIPGANLSEQSKGKTHRKLGFSCANGGQLRGLHLLGSACFVLDLVAGGRLCQRSSVSFQRQRSLVQCKI